MHIRTLMRKAAQIFRFNKRGAQFHFIHIPKNAGETVRASLYLDRNISFSNPYHFRYIDIADKVGRELKFFAVVRNPWSRTASRYHFGRQNATKWPIDDPRRRFMETATFSDFVTRREILPIPRHPDKPWMGPLSSWFNQLEWIRDESSAVACDCLRMEALEDDISLYFNRRIHLKAANITRQRYDYRSMYSDRLAELVAEYFRDDIEHFGFDFDGPATRNTVATQMGAA